MALQRVIESIPKIAGCITNNPALIDASTYQTAVLFVDTREFIQTVAKSIHPAPVTVTTIVNASLSRIASLISKRPNMYSLLFGDVYDHPKLSPCEQFRAYPHSMRHDGAGYDALMSDDSPIGMLMYSELYDAQAALRDPHMEAFYISRIFIRIIDAIVADIKTIVPVEKTGTRNFTIGILHALMRDGFYASTALDMLHNNYVTINCDTRKAVASACSTVNSLVVVADAISINSRTRRYRTAMEVISSSEHVVLALLLLQKRDALINARNAGPDRTTESALGVNRLYYTVSMDDMTKMLSMETLFGYLHFYTKGVDKFVAMWMFTYGSIYWPGIELLGTRDDRARDESVTDAFLISSLVNDAYESLATLSLAGKELRLVIDSALARHYMLEMHIRRTEYLRAINSTARDNIRLASDYMHWYFGTGCLIDVADNALFYQICAMRRDVLASIMYGTTPSVSGVLIPHNPERKKRLYVVKTYPYAGDGHLLTMQRRVIMAAYAITQMLYPMHLPTDDASRLANVFMRKGTLSLGDENTLTYRVGNGSFMSMLSAIGYRMYIDNAGTYVKFEEAPPLATLDATNIYGGNYAVNVFFPPSNIQQINNLTSAHINEMINKAPLFIGVSTLPINVNSAEEGIFSKLEKVAAHMIVALNKINIDWMKNYRDLVAKETRVLGDASFTPNEYLCLMLTYGLEVIRCNGLEPVLRDDGDVGPLRAKEGYGQAAMKMIVPVVKYDALDAEKYPLNPIAASNTGFVSNVAYTMEGIDRARVDEHGVFMCVTKGYANDAIDYMANVAYACSANIPRATFREAYYRSARSMPVRSSIITNGLVVVKPNASPIWERSAGIMSPLQEVCDYAHPLLREDTGPVIWDNILIRSSSIWGEVMEYAWIGVMRFKISQTAYMKELSITGAALQPNKVIALIHASPSGMRNRFQKRWRTWATAFLAYKNHDTRNLAGIEYDVLRKLKEPKNKELLQNLNLVFPIMHSTEVLISDKQVAIFLLGWQAHLAKHYVSHVVRMAEDKKLGAWNALVDRTYSLSIKIGTVMFQVSIYLVNNQ